MSEHSKNTINAHIGKAQAAKKTLRGGGSIWPVWGNSRRDPVKFVPVLKTDAAKWWGEALRLDLAKRTKGSHGGVGYAGLRFLNSLIYDFFNFATGECFPSYEAIRDKTGMSTKTIARAISRLSGFGIIRKERRAPWNDEKGRLVQESNAYWLKPPIEWVQWTPRAAKPIPEPGTWGAHPTQQEEPLTAAANAILEGARGLAQKLLEGGEPESLADRLARLGRLRGASS